MSRLLPTAVQPLFDRLGAAPAAAQDWRGPGPGRLDARGLRESLAREVGALLNTRSRLGLEDFIARAEGPGLSLLDYGLPDLSPLTPASADDRDTLRRAVHHCLARFEPRLQHTEVQVSPLPGQALRARLSIDAAVALGPELRRVQFDLAADAQSVGLRPLPEGAA
ncbi:type VI secretion system baseplate subunit TssE [Ideonella livida]|uniref:Type VI secretion system baseplate subunit TssE n=1 Tax=Ideonella livida TaxID=2707176 RepID=A0A7C9PKV0_9BURK|nr:type VI secretion system baseplate subunit TssE [Ideonella livida]NDY94031.1 type VI secretion system baseplate subunit TssE [Ideonella livida]